MNISSKHKTFLKIISIILIPLFFFTSIFWMSGGDAEDCLRRIFTLKEDQSYGTSLTSDRATEICRILSRFNIICSFTLNASKNPNFSENLLFKRGLGIFKSVFNLSSEKAFYAFEDQGRNKEEILRIENEELFSADIRTLHLRRMEWKDKLYTMNLVSSATTEIFSDKNSILYEVVRIIKPKYISLHLGASSEKVSYGITDRPYDIAEVSPLSREEVFRRMVENINILQANLKMIDYDKPVLLETLDYHPTGAYEYVTEPDFIKKVLADTGAHLLMDCAHIYISARNRGHEDYMSYIKQIINEDTIGLIDEVHLTVPGPNRTAPTEIGTYLDYHLPFYIDTEESRAVKRILSYILQLREMGNISTPIVVNFETDVDESLKHIEALVETLESVNSRGEMKKQSNRVREEKEDAVLWSSI